MKQTSTELAPVHRWLADPLPKDVAIAIDRLARTDDARHVAIMPDVHLASEVCVGVVLATRKLIYPDAVGGDIGCGIAALAFDVDADVLRDEQRAARIFQALGRLVPILKHPRTSAHDVDSLPFGGLSLSDPRLEAIARRDGRAQMGTLGRGNHFLEFQADEENRLWLMVHSGSRAMGQAIRSFHLRHACRSTTGLMYLDADADQSRAYLSDVEWARAYAMENRRRMTEAACHIGAEILNAASDSRTYINCDHNHVRLETHFGEALYVHRKGAASAGLGEAGIIPGSMGSESYHVEGRGCPQSLMSSSHGAGRAMSRHEARQTVSARELRRQLKGIWFDARVADALREESPSAYKDVRQVMRAQRELVRITRRLRPILCYKGP